MGAKILLQLAKDVISVKQTAAKKILPVLLLSIFFSIKILAQCPSAPTVTSPVNYCMNTTAVPLTATGSSLSWGGAQGTVGGNSALTSAVYIDASVSNNKKTNFTTTSANLTINSIDYYIPAYQSVSGLVIAIYNNSGTVIATSSTNTTQSAGASAVKITCTFNYVIAAAGNYSVGASAGSGNIGYDNPAFPITESSGTINITGVSGGSYRCFNNISFGSVSATAPTPLTTTAGSTNYYVTQTANGCASSPATITVVITATGGSAPTVTSPLSLCKNTTASALTASGSNLSWGGATGTVGGTSVLSTAIYVDNSSNNLKTNFTTTGSTIINTVDYYIPPYQSVNNLVLAIFNSSGTIIATSSTSTNQSAVASALKITNTFNYTISTPGNYSIGVSSGSGNIGYDNPSFPITEPSGTINITGVSNSGYRCFNNVAFTLNSNPVAPVPSTATTGTTSYYVTQTVSGCTSPSATINVVITATGGSAPTVTTPVQYCLNTTAAQLTATGTNLLWSGGTAGGTGSVGGTTALSSAVYIDNTSGNNRKTNFTVTTGNITINSIDYYIPANQAVNGLVLCLYNNSGTVIATSATNTTQTAGATDVKITNTFNYTITTAGNYSIGASAGTGNIGYDNPSFPITEVTGTVNITGVSSPGNRCFNNIVFKINSTSTAPTPSTSSTGATNYTITQTVNGCTSPAAHIVVNVSNGGSATIAYSSASFCKTVSGSQAVTRTGTGGGTYSSASGLTIDATTGAITPSTSTPASYTVTYTMSVGCTTTATTTVTIIASPNATINYTSNPFCSGPGTATATITGTTGGTFSSTAGLSINAANGDIDLAASTAGAYTVTYTIAASGGCSQVQTTASVSITIPGAWYGSADNDWGNSSNWGCSLVPVSSSNVTIPAGLINYPVISATAAVNNISIASGASLTLSNATLQIAGTVSNSGIFNAGNGNIEMIGSAAQTIPANTFQDNAVRNLIISNTSTGVTLGGQVDVYNNLTFTGSSIIRTNDVLTLRSTSAATASIGNTANDNIVGKVTVERYINARKAWRLLSIPTNTTQTIKGTWQESAANTSSNPVRGYGIQITSNLASWSAAGFDLSSPGGPSMKTYAPATNLWNGISSTNSGTIKTASGYMTFIRGDRTCNAFNSVPTETILRTTGSLYTGTQPVINIGPNLFAVIGNPYASMVDMRSITKSSGMKDFFYVWDPNLGGSSGYGAFQTFSKSGSNYVVTPGMGSYGPGGSVNNYLESGQAFMIQARAGGGTVTFTESSKYLNPSSRVAQNDSTPQTPQLRIGLSGVNADNSNYMIDGLHVDYDEIYSNAVDDDDALKSTNTSENLSIKNDNSLLIIERRHSIADNDTIQLNLTNEKVMQYKFEISADNFNAQGLAGFLEDNYLNTSTPLNLAGTTTATFNIVNIPGSYAPGRFKIVFNKLNPVPVTFTSIKAYEQNSRVNIEWKADNEINISNYITEHSKNGTQFSDLSITNARANNTGTATYNTIDAAPFDGYNFYRVKSVGIDGKFAYTNIVKVQIEKKKQGITPASGLITDKLIDLKFNNMPAGNYTVNLFNGQGQKVFTRNIQYSGGSRTESINIDKSLVHGVYQLQVVTMTNETLIYKLVY